MKPKTITIAAGCVALLLLGACDNLPKVAKRGETRDPAEEVAKSEKVSTDDLRDRLREYADRFSLRIQTAANRIAEETDDPKIRKRSAYWKIFSIPNCREMVARKEPAATLVDLWAFCLQMENFFASEGGEKTFGEEATHAHEAMRDLRVDIEQLASAVLPEDKFPQAKESMDAFAREHMISPFFTRASTSISMLSASKQVDLEWVVDTVLTPLRAIGGLDETALAIHEASAVADRATETVQHLPELVRWNAEILAYELEEHDSVRTSVEAIDLFSKSTERLAQRLDTLPKELRQEVTTALSEAEEHQVELQETLRETRATIDATEKSLESLDSTAKNLAAAGGAWEETFRSLHTMVNDFRGRPAPADADADAGAGAESENDDESQNTKTSDRAATDRGLNGPIAVAHAEEASKSRNFDILDYARAAEEIGKAASSLREATAQLHELARSKDVQDAVNETRASAASLATHIAVLSAVLLCLFFGCLVGYRWITARLGRVEATDR